MGTPEFVYIEVDPGDASPDGIALRFKVAGNARSIARLYYEHEDGSEGWWWVWAVDSDDALGQSRRAAQAVPVEDSSEGTVVLVAGGRYGLLLEHVETGQLVREAYLVLAASTPMECDSEA